MAECSVNDCEPKKQMLETAQFRGTVLQSLKDIKDTLESRKGDNKAEFDAVWSAIGELRKDVKYLSVKAAAIGGASGVIITLLGLLLKTVMHA